MDNLNAIAVVNFHLFPGCTPHDFAIHLDGDSLWWKCQLLNQFAQAQWAVGKFALLTIDLNQHEFCLGGVDDAPYFCHLAVAFRANQQGAAPGLKFRQGHRNRRMAVTIGR